MDLKKEFDIKYKPREVDSQFILFADMQEDYFGVKDETGITLFGTEIVNKCLHPTKYYRQFDVLYYDNFETMLKDINFIIHSVGNRPIPIIFHEIDDRDKWEENAKEFEKGVKNALLLLMHPDYVFKYDLIYRSI